MSLESRIKAAAQRLIKAEIANSWKGAQDPQDIPHIERELLLRRKRFNEAVDRISSTIQQAKINA